MLRTNVDNKCCKCCDSMQQSHVALISPFITQRDFVAHRMSHVFVASCKRALNIAVVRITDNQG